MLGRPAGTYDRRIRIQRPVADESFDGAGSGSWEDVITVWANVQDILPSRGEKLSDGMNMSARPARVRIRFRRGITADMRFQIGRTVKNADGEKVWETDRTVQVISGPAELGRREELEFMVEEYRPAGNPA